MNAKELSVGARWTLRLAGVLVLALATAMLVQPSAQSADAVDECGLPEEPPLWIEFGAGSVPPEVRAVFARPGVVVGASGTALPQQYRDKGAATTFFTLSLPNYVGRPAEPAPPDSVQPEADQLFEQAVASTACQKPIIALNELLGPDSKTPWSPTTTQYRANILTLVERLTQRGARPVLLVHGNPYTGGDARVWWTRLGRSADVVYEAYYNAQNISRLGPLMGNRRMRLGMRNIVGLFSDAGIPVEKTGFMLGFQVAIGAAGREGLQPREEWFRFVKWNALAARQVAADEGATSIWSWGWGNFGPQSVDPDKPAAACVYLWTRNPALCDGPAVAGPAFNTSLTEGQIVLPAGVQCNYPRGVVATASMNELARLTKNQQVALTGLFARGVLRQRVAVPPADVLRAEQRTIQRVFKGSRKAYLRALQKRNVSLAVARGILADNLRQRRIAAMLAAEGTGQTTLVWSSDLEAAAVDAATCLRDALPGTGNFPQSNAREVGAVPLPGYLPFLLGDRTAPAAPGAPTATLAEGAVVLDWPDGAEPDLIGYHVYRATAAGGPYTRLTQAPIVRSTYTDAAVPAGTTPFYVLRAMDTTRNLSGPSAEATPPPTPPA